MRKTERVSTEKIIFLFLQYTQIKKKILEFERV